MNNNQLPPDSMKTLEPGNDLGNGSIEMRLKDLSNEIEIIKVKLERDKKWYEKFESWLSVISTAIALPVGVSLLWNTLIRRPIINIDFGPKMLMKLNQKTQTLTCLLDLVIGNEGNQSETIKPFSVHFKEKNMSPNWKTVTNVPTGDISFTVGDENKTILFVKETPLIVSMSMILVDMNAEQLKEFMKDSLHQMEIVLVNTDGGRYNDRICLTFQPNNLEEIMGNRSTYTNLVSCPD